MWSVSGLSCRKFGSCHSHIDDGVCSCSHWNHLFLSSSFMCIYAMNWMIFFFYFSLVVFDGLIITSSLAFVNTFLCFYAIIFIYLFCYVFIFYNLFVFFYYFLLIYAIVKLWRTGWYVANGRSGRTGGAGEASEV